MTEPDGFTPRPYPDIVRDLLTTLTGGVVREPVVVPAGDTVVLSQLAHRPLRRISHLQGVIEVERPVRDASGAVVLTAGGDPETELVDLAYRFTDVDFELVSTGADGDALDAIRFRKTGRKPPVGSTVTVNYYPAESRPAPLTDLNVGSVARTMMEAMARELAVEELLLENVYRSAFLETAEGPNLDKVVALVGVRRRPAGVATTRVRFVRAPGSVGRITVPTGTVVADRDGNGDRYATTGPLVLEPGEPSREVLAAGVSRSTAAVEAGVLTRPEVLIAGVASVTNDSPAAAAAAPETDDELRRRARGALAVAARGTLDALKFGILSLDGVKDVAVTEFPNGVPGEVRVDVAYDREPDDALLAAVDARILDLRPAGVRVKPQRATLAPVAVAVTLTLAGDGVASADLPALVADLEARVVAHAATLPPGGTLRQARLATAALEDPRIVDAVFELSLDGPPAATVTADEGAVLDVTLPLSCTVVTESGAAGPGLEIQLDAMIPVHLASGVTAADATSAIQAAAAAYASSLGGGAAVSVDGLVAALRDDTRYAIVRAELTAMTEAGDRFLQLADGVGAQPVGATDRVLARQIDVDVREGGV